MCQIHCNRKFERASEGGFYHSSLVLVLRYPKKVVEYM